MNVGGVPLFCRAGIRFSNLALMLVVTINEIPGWEIRSVYGEVMGLSVRQKNAMGIVGMLGAQMQNALVNLAHTRREALGRLMEETRNRGGNAVVAMRFDTTELSNTLTEICAYGTAVLAVPVTPAAKNTAQQLGYGPSTSATALSTDAV